MQLSYLRAEAQHSHHKEEENSPERGNRHLGQGFRVHHKRQARTLEKQEYSRYLKVVGTTFYKFKLPEVQINLHFG